MRILPVLVYTVLRLLAFLVPFGILMLFPAFQELPWLAAIFAALIGLSVSMIFLRRPLGQVSEQIQHQRDAARGARTVRTDEEVEDAEAEEAASPAEPSTSPVAPSTDQQG